MQIQKPRAVIDAVNLLWLSVALSALSFAYILVFPVDLAGAYHDNSAIPAAQYKLMTKIISATIPITGILTVAYTAFIAYKISQGRNWARLWYLISFVLGIVFMLITFDQTFSGAGLRKFITIIQTLLQAYIFWLLVCKSSVEWFKEIKLARKR